MSNHGVKSELGYQFCAPLEIFLLLDLNIVWPVVAVARWPVVLSECERDRLEGHVLHLCRVWRIKKNDLYRQLGVWWTKDVWSWGPRQCERTDLGRVERFCWARVVQSAQNMH